MEDYKILKEKSDEDLLNFISGKGFAAHGAGSDSNALQRDLAKAILDERSTRIMKKHNTIMIWLTSFIAVLTFVVAILTALLVYKEFWQAG